MVHNTTDEQMARYRATVDRLAQDRLQRLQWKHQRVWEVAHQAAELVKEHYGAQQVAVFGSMLSCDRVDEHSNLVLAVWELDPKLYYQAVSHLLDLEPTLSIDLVEVESAKPRIRAAIEGE